MKMKEFGPRAGCPLGSTNRQLDGTQTTTRKVAKFEISD